MLDIWQWEFKTRGFFYATHFFVPTVYILDDRIFYSSCHVPLIWLSAVSRSQHPQSLFLPFIFSPRHIYSLPCSARLYIIIIAHGLFFFAPFFLLEIRVQRRIPLFTLCFCIFLIFVAKPCMSRFMYLYKKEKEKSSRSLDVSWDRRVVSLGAIQCHTTPRQMPASQIVPFSFIHI